MRKNRRRSICALQIIRGAKRRDSSNAGALRAREGELWKAHLEAPSDQTRNALWLHYRVAVFRAARVVAASLPRHVEYDDLVSAGELGLVRSIARFDPAQRARFLTFAMPRITGAMLDFARNAEWMPRMLRSQVNRAGEAREALQHALGRRASAAEVSERLGTPVRFETDIQPRQTYSLESEERWNRCRLADRIGDPRAADPTSPEADRIAYYLNLIPAGQPREIARKHYVEGVSLKEIGKQFGFGESRACQVLADARKAARKRAAETGYRSMVASAG